MSQDERAELERLRAETAELRSQQAGKSRRRRFSWRTPVSIVLIVLGCVLGPVAVLAVWAGNEVSDTGRWVATVEPLIHDPAIQNVLTDKITAEVTSQLDLEGTVNQAAAQLDQQGLPRISSLLQTFGPQITSAVTGFIHSTVHRIVSGPRVAKLWVQVNTVAHQSLVQVLSGEGNGAISTKNGHAASVPHPATFRYAPRTPFARSRSPSHPPRIVAPRPDSTTIAPNTRLIPLTVAEFGAVAAS